MRRLALLWLCAVVATLVGCPSSTGPATDADAAPPAPDAAVGDLAPAADLGVDAPPAPTPCQTHDACAAAEYCHRDAADRLVLYSHAPLPAGSCRPLPADCAASDDPFCAYRGLSVIVDPRPPAAPQDNPLLAQYPWAPKVAVDLRATGAPANTTAYGGMHLTRIPTASAGPVRVVFPTVRLTSHQRAADGQLGLRLVDEAGDALPFDDFERSGVDEIALVFAPAGFELKPMLRITWQHERLPSAFLLRWALDLETTVRAVDLSQPVPLADLATVPAEVKAWLAPAPMIQSEHPEIVAVAAKAAQGATTLQELVQGTLAQMAALRKPFPMEPVDFQNDALSFLQTGLGDCYANANLFAALMRASGAPCRVVNQIMQRPEGQNMHAVNEYFVPGVGWVLVEPQAQQLQWSFGGLLDTGVVHPDLEQRGRGYMHYDGIQQLTMLGQVVDDAGAPVPLSSAPVIVVPALVTANSPNPWLAIHGAP